MDEWVDEWVDEWMQRETTSASRPLVPEGGEGARSDDDSHVWAFLQ